MEAIHLLGEYAEVKNRHDVAEMLARTHPDCQYEDAGVDRVVAGHAELRRYHEHLFAAVPDYSASLEGIAGVGDTAVAWGRLSGTLATPLFGRGQRGDRLDVAAVFVCTYRDGLLYRERAHVDLVSLRKQLAPPAQRFVDALTAAWSRPTGAGLSALFTEDATIRHPGMCEPVRGRPAIRAYFDRVLAARPDLELRTVTSATTGHTTFVQWHTRTISEGCPLSWEGVDLFRLRGTLAEHAVVHFDPTVTRPDKRAS
ncbi:nuclear transport factor 2 family protein [Streptomyces spiralis]|uniref:nuclear transport factor 2 family protein n=1 Tax=Streptomyces spiralis TaxID=66376 RepID=UPI0036CDA148